MLQKRKRLSTQFGLESLEQETDAVQAETAKRNVHIGETWIKLRLPVKS